MLGQPQVALYSLSRYYNEKVMTRKATICKTIHTLCKVVQDILKEVEAQEPRFVSTLVEDKDAGRYMGVHVISATEFEMVLYLNQMGVFNFVDDGTLYPGQSALKLNDGRKRSMSLWVEFITASGYLSARKIRSRFQTLVAQAVEKSAYRDNVKMIADTSDVKLRIQDQFVVQIICSFRCAGIWPRTANFWPLNAANINWPEPSIVAEVKTDGFDLFSREQAHLPKASQQSSSSMEGDAWSMSFTQAEDNLMQHGCRRRVYSILKCLRDAHLSFANSPISAYILKTLILFECEKHPHELNWTELEMGDRIVVSALSTLFCAQARPAARSAAPTPRPGRQGHLATRPRAHHQPAIARNTLTNCDHPTLSLSCLSFNPNAVL